MADSYNKQNRTLSSWTVQYGSIRRSARMSGETTKILSALDIVLSYIVDSRADLIMSTCMVHDYIIEFIVVNNLE